MDRGRNQWTLAQLMGAVAVAAFVAGAVRASGIALSGVAFAIVTGILCLVMPDTRDAILGRRCARCGRRSMRPVIDAYGQRSLRCDSCGARLAPPRGVRDLPDPPPLDGVHGALLRHKRGRRDGPPA